MPEGSPIPEGLQDLGGHWKTNPAGRHLANIMETKVGDSMVKLDFHFLWFQFPVANHRKIKWKIPELKKLFVLSYVPL